MNNFNLIFPGQGSQTVGMGLDLYQNHKKVLLPSPFFPSGLLPSTSTDRQLSSVTVPSSYVKKFTPHQETHIAVLLYYICPPAQPSSFAWFYNKEEKLCSNQLEA